MRSSSDANPQCSHKTSAKTLSPIAHATTSSFTDENNLNHQSHLYAPQFRPYPVQSGNMTNGTLAESPSLFLPHHRSATLFSFDSAYHIFQNLEELPLDCASYLLNPQNMLAMEDEAYISQEGSFSQALSSPLVTIETQTHVEPAAYETVCDQQWENAWIVDENLAISPTFTGSIDSGPCTPMSSHNSFCPDLAHRGNSVTENQAPDPRMFISDANPCLPTMSQLNTQVDPQKRSTLHDSVSCPYGGSIFKSQMRGFSHGLHDDQHCLAPCQVDQDSLVQSESLSPVLHREQEMSNDDGWCPEKSNGRGDGNSIVRIPCDTDLSVAPQAHGFTREDDEFIVKLRRDGVSYEEIHRLGHFKQAVSTLRGRFRNATKRKQDRPRKQIWNSKDVDLLVRAVEYFAPDEQKRNKAPWKKISVWMKEQGATYEFAPASISKKWHTLARDEE